jgi:hypothetical protein
MSTIELSAGFIPGFMARIVDYTTNRYYNSFQGADQFSIPQIAGQLGLLTSGAQYSSVTFLTPTINIMKGTIPADINAVASYASRSTDILISYSPTTNVIATSSLYPNSNPTVITANGMSSQAGTATWFWWVSRKSYNYNPQDGIVHQICGTVGVTGSGADLEISSTNVILGNDYRISNLRLQFNTTFTF